MTNIPYEPELNGIETLFAKTKSLFRKAITKAKIAKQEFDTASIVREIHKSINTSEIKAFANHGWKQLFGDHRNPLKVLKF